MAHTLAATALGALVALNGLTLPTAGGPQAEVEETFSERVDGFWRWFKGVEGRLHRGMFDKQIAQLQREVGARVHAVVPGLKWSFGPGDAPGEHALVLSPSGSRDLRLLTEVWVATAPELEGWVFRPAEPPTALENAQFGVGDAEIDARAARLTLDTSGTDGRLNARVWHPAYGGLDDRTRAWLARFLVEEALGEDRTMAWLGDVQPLEQRPTEALGLEELQASAGERAAAAGLEQRVAFDAWSTVTLDAPKSGGFERAELRQVTTSVPWLVRAHHTKRGRPKDPLRRTGASYATLRVPLEDLGEGIDAAALADLLAQRLPTARIVGHAQDGAAAFVDLLVLDRARTVEDLARTLRATECARTGTLLRMTRGGPKPLQVR